MASRWLPARLACVAAAALMAVPAFAAPPLPPVHDGFAASEKDGRIRTQFAPRNEVVISSELSAKIASLPLREGDAFRAGQSLVAFDCTLFQAQLNKAQAMLEAARQTLGVTRRLAELNSAGALEVQQAEAREKEGAAEVAYMKATVSKCGIAAPFAGRIAKRLVANHQYVTPGTPLLGLIDTGELELQLIVPSRWLAWLKPGARFTVQVDELAKNIDARVTRIGARIDPVSQSVGLTGAVDGNAAGLLPGMSGWATFPNGR
jgi:membrane fusion protein (multidrug efflux system)